MAFLSSESQSEIRKIFADLSGDVRLLFFTQRDSPLIIPGQDCPTCKDTRALLEEVVALSDKLHLEIHEVAPDSEIAREHGIDRVPALVMMADVIEEKRRSQATLDCRRATSSPCCSEVWWTCRKQRRI